MEIKEICLDGEQTFYGQYDENMFFNAIYSIPSFVKIKGVGKKLFLSYNHPMSHEEK
jgi:hypothetical protein